MEMEMGAMEDIEMAEDITPPSPPLTSALHDSFLLTHCSFCFSPLPISPISHYNLLRYCSSKCSDSDSITADFFSAVHVPFSDTADLRASLRLLRLLLSNPSAWRSAPPERIFGLLTNREKLMLVEDDDEVLVRIRKGADAMAASRRTNSADIRHGNALEEAVLCLVITNAVEVQDLNGRTIGIAVYDPTFCWINHSCSPNACYRFETSSDSFKTRLRISPKCTDLETGEGSCSQVIVRTTNNLDGCEHFSPSRECELLHECFWQMGTVRSNLSDFIRKDFQSYGPRVVVRSIKSIRKGEAVTIAYCDLLQPKEMRQSELWSRYQFLCSCHRCSTKPPTYVDHALQEISAVKEKLFVGSTSIRNFDNDNAVRRIKDYVDNAINEYLSIGSPESCCEKLENLLTLGFCDEHEEDEEGKQLLNLRLHPLHYLSLNAYTALASAYKVRSYDLLASDSKMGDGDGDEHRHNASTMSKTSAAYSLLLAGATHHLFLAEPSLIASAANCWVVAGESLLILARSSSLWATNTSKWSFPVDKRMCSNCSWVDKFNASRIHGRSLKADFCEFSSGISNCIANISQKSWSFLTHGCPYFKAFSDPFDFSWLKMTTTNSNNRDIRAHSIDHSSAYSKTRDIVSQCEPQVHSDEERQSIFELGIHCVSYGGYLASICYGHHSHLASQIQNILDEMN